MVFDDSHLLLFFIVVRLHSVVPAIVVNCILPFMQLLSNPLSAIWWSNGGGNSENMKRTEETVGQGLHIKCIS